VKLWRSRRGNVAVMTGLLAVPLTAFAGLATDGARAWVLQSRLYSAVDAAALAMARNVGVAAATRDLEAAGMFWTNFAPGTVGNVPQGALIGGNRSGFMNSAAVFQQPVQLDVGTVRVSATASIPAYFTRLLGYQTLTVNATGEARRADIGLELALVLDVTGSMDTNCGTPSNRTDGNCGVTTVPALPDQVVTGRNNNMDLLRLAAADLVNVLYGSRDVSPNLWVSVVPYSTTINIGTGPSREAWLDPTSRTNLAADFSPSAWRGCVEARVGYPGAPADGDRVDYPPSAHAFRPFLYRSTIGDYTLVTATRPAGNNTQTTVTRDIVAGDNDWARLDWATNTVGQNAITEAYQLWRGNNNVGPNVGCPTTPVLPLTASKATILNTIQNLRPSFRGGTMGNIGLLGGWFTLSPNWRAAWNLGPPPTGWTTPLPLDYNSRYMRKVIVMMTDGANGWFDFPGGFPGACSVTAVNTNSFPTAASGVAPPGPAQHLVPAASMRPPTPPAVAPTPVVCPSPATTTICPSPLPPVAAGATYRCLELRPGAAPVAGNADYTGYGRPSDNRATPAQLNARMAQLCTDIKSTNDRITIYTVVLNTSGNVDAATQTLYQNCASVPGNYYLVSQPTQLRPAFQQIGQQLANLRLVR
jgi:Flp pilus assembly protein TadG